MWLQSVIEHRGEYFGTTSFNDIYHFDDNINLKSSLKMPFVGEARGGSYNRKNVIVTYYGGIDEVTFINNELKEKRNFSR